MKAKKILSIVSGLILILIIAAVTISEKPITPRRWRTSGAMEALQFLSASRAYPDIDIPARGYYDAFLYSRLRMEKQSVQAVHSKPWKSLGPTNIGGRTKVIAINPLNPNSIYVGSASGGLWHTHNSGVGANAWHYVDTGFPVLGISALVIDPEDTSVIYIGTGEVYGYQNALVSVAIRTTRGSYGIGILKTTDAGESWTKSLDWTYHQQRGVQCISINPLDTKVLYAATTEGTYKSTDAGLSWTLVHDVIMAMDVDINPLNPDIVFVCCGDLGSKDAGVYRTKDGGATWELQKNGLIWGYTGKSMLDIYRQNPDIIYVHIANSNKTIGIWKSTDGGDFWQRVSSEDIAKWQGWYSHYVAVHPTNPDIVFAGGIDIWKSTDGGKTFQTKSYWYLWYFGNVPAGGPEGPTNYAHADHHALTFHPSNPDIIYFATDGGVFRSRYGGEKFEGLNGGYITTQFYNGFSCALTDSFLAIGGMQDNATAVYEGKPAWRRVAGGDGCHTAIDNTNHNTLFASSQTLNILKSTDRGNTWLNATAGIYNRDKACFVAPYLLSLTDPNLLYAGTDRIYKSTDAAQSWISTSGIYALDGNPILSMAVSAKNPDTLYVASAPVRVRANVFRTFDGCKTWEIITGDSTFKLPDRYPMDIAVAPTNSRKIYVVFSGFGTSHLYKSIDAGSTWVDIGNGLPDVPSSAVALDPLFQNHIYLGNDLGVYVSIDDGESWQQWSDGMPTTLVMDLTISPSNRTIRAVTHGNGVWERKLIGDQAVSVPSQEIPKEITYHLYQNYPNPFSISSGDNARTTIDFELSAPSIVKVTVHNVLGQEVARLLDGFQSAGRHRIDFHGKGLSPGVYFYTLRTRELVHSRKMLLIE